MGMMRTRWAAIGAAVAVAVGAGGGFGLARATVNSGDRNVFAPITPCRLFDTRPATQVGPRSTPLGPAGTQTWSVWGTNGNCTIPAGATGIVINITVPPGATSNTFLTAWPTGDPRPTAANLNVKGADTAATPNLATVKLSAAGQFDLFNNAGSAHVIGDILGYFDHHTHDDRYTRPVVGTVVTVAGDGTAGFLDGAGTNSRFDDPSAIAVAPDGTLYVADSLNHRIRKITPAGVVSTLAGSTAGFANGTGAAAQFNGPFGVAVAANGDVYVADTLNHRIRKITPAGVVSTLAGSTAGFADGAGIDAQFHTPIGIALAPNGDLYVADSFNHRIRKVTPGGTVSTLAGSTFGFADGAGAAAQFNLPRGVAVAANGDVYVTDAVNRRVRKVTPGGVVSTLAGSGAGAAVDGVGTDARFDEPRGIVVAPSGDLYVTDAVADKLLRVTTDGAVTTVAGGVAGFADGVGIQAQFDNPRGLALAPNGELYVADTGNDRIRRIA